MVTSPPDTRWRRLKLSYPSVYRNLAVDESLARALSTGVQTQPTLRLWTNAKAVVVGRFQDVPTEVDLRQCEMNQVQIARRFTGGGTVFHDEATLSLTLVARPRNGPAHLRFEETYLQLVREALEDLGLSCLASGNSILVGGRKICGAAAAVGMHFALWHCSILVDTNLEVLDRVLAPSKSRTRSRFVHSRWQEVTTLAKALSRPIGIDEVARILETTLERWIGDELKTDPLTIEEKRYSEALYARKYSSRAWNLNGNHGFKYSSAAIDGLTPQLPYGSVQPP